MFSFQQLITFKFCTVKVCLLACIVLLFVATNVAANDSNAVDDSNKLFRLNYNQVDIHIVIDDVAQITQKNFIINPKVKGRVTIITEQPMNRDEVYQLFISTLAVHGYATVIAGEMIKIVPLANAK